MCSRPKPGLGCIFLAILASLALVPLEAASQPAPRKRLVVLEVFGPDGGVVRAALLRGLADRVALLDAEEFNEMLARVEAIDRRGLLSAACEMLGVDALVEGTVRATPSGRFADLVVRSCEDGAAVASERIGLLPSGADGIAETSWLRLGPAIESSLPGRSVRGPEPAREPCVFTEMEPTSWPERADWVRRRQRILVSCEQRSFAINSAWQHNRRLLEALRLARAAITAP